MKNPRGDFIAVVNRAFATRYLSSPNTLGRQLRVPGLTPKNRYRVNSAQITAWRQIIGIVGDARNDGVDGPVVPAIYLPYSTVIPAYVQYFVRTQAIRSTTCTPLRRDRIRRLRPANLQQHLQRLLHPQQSHREGRAVQPPAALLHIVWRLFCYRAGARTGRYLQRRRLQRRPTNDGVRSPPGARRATGARPMGRARIALVSAAAGIVIGLAVDGFLGAVLAHWMQSGFGAGSLFAAAALLALSALLACLLPARHAIAVPPAEALRYE